MLTSAEKSIRALAEKAKVEREQGETLRWIDVPATFGGRDHIFDRAASATQSSKKERGRVFANIVTDCEANHGVAIEEYVGRIINAEFDARDRARAAIASFVQHITDPSDGTVTRDVATKFGLVYAGGILGIELGIVPWQQDELLDAISKCYRGARDLLPDEGVALRQGMALLKGRLEGLPRRKVQKADEATDWGKVEGYRVRRDSGNRYIIKREVFNGIFASIAQRDLVVQHLIEENRIILALCKGGAAATPKPKQQFTWPDGERRRSYKIMIPSS
jgi:hypothetical protein